jgi:hypothetical protein
MSQATQAADLQGGGKGSLEKGAVECHIQLAGLESRGLETQGAEGEFGFQGEVFEQEIPVVEGGTGAHVVPDADTSRGKGANGELTRGNRIQAEVEALEDRIAARGTYGDIEVGQGDSFGKECRGSLFVGGGPGGGPPSCGIQDQGDIVELEF